MNNGYPNQSGLDPSNYPNLSSIRNNTNYMQATLSSSINIGKNSDNSKVHSSKKNNNLALGALELLTSRNATRSLDKYAAE